jgi:hypothetical protein
MSRKRFKGSGRGERRGEVIRDLDQTSRLMGHTSKLLGISEKSDGFHIILERNVCHSRTNTEKSKMRTLLQMNLSHKLDLK